MAMAIKYIIGYGWKMVHTNALVVQPGNIHHVK